MKMTILILFILFVLFYIGFKITGALLSAILWVAIKLPLAIIFWAIGICLCFTIIFIPVGKSLIKAGTAMIT